MIYMRGYTVCHAAPTHKEAFIKRRYANAPHIWEPSGTVGFVQLVGCLSVFNVQYTQCIRWYNGQRLHRTTVPLCT